MCHYAVAECPCAEFGVLFIITLNCITLNVVMLSVVMLSVVMMSVVMLSVVMLSVVMVSGLTLDKYKPALATCPFSTLNR